MVSLSVMLLTLALVGIGLFFIFKMNANPELKKAKAFRHGRQFYKPHKKEKQQQHGP